MKRIHNLFILALLAVVASFIFTGCGSENSEDKTDPNGLQLISSYELLTVKIESQPKINEDISGAYLLGFGGMYGNPETTATKVYEYCYKREDGGVIPATIDMSSYDCPETVTVVIYEDDSTTPKVEIWRNYDAQVCGDGDGGDAFYIPKPLTEFRFTIPSGSFVNTYDLQGLTENAQ